MTRTIPSLLVVALLGCVRENPTPQVQPEPTARTTAARTEAHAAPVGPTVAAAQGVAPAAPTAPAAVVDEGAPGCAAHGMHAAAPAPAAGAQALGAPITVTETTALAAIAAHPAQYAGRAIRTEGTVSAVCQAAGCWMQISDAAQRVHVKMHGHSFFIPRNASGRRARVQGTVVGGNPNGHCEQEAAEATGQQAAQRLEIDATGVELL